MQIDLGDLGFEEGGRLLGVKRALRQAPQGVEIEVAGSPPELELHLLAWRRAEGHAYRKR
jgi:hypothetical protein